WFPAIFDTAECVPINAAQSPTNQDKQCSANPKKEDGHYSIEWLMHVSQAFNLSMIHKTDSREA
ncbi:hypothetical protein, partial [Roseiconus lacunae]